MHFKADNHVHSTFSVDAKDSLEAMVRAAIAKGLHAVCFTEHIDYNPRDHGYGFFNYEKYSAELERVREQYADQIRVLKGIEFSEPHRYPVEFERELKRDYDLVLAGLHWLDDNFYGEPELAAKLPPEQILERYFNDLEQLVAFGGFDALAHFDFPRRYYRDQQEVQTTEALILKELVQTKIIPEVNTSGFRKGYPDSMPKAELLRKFHELGGRRLIFGSDAHAADQLGTGFAEAWEGIGALEGWEIGIFMERSFVRAEELVL